MTTKQTLLSGGDGTAVPAGAIGESLEATSAIASTTTESDPVATAAQIILTTGRWLVSATIQSAGTGATLLYHRLYLKGVNTTTNGKDYFISTIPSGVYTDHSFSGVVVDILPATATKKVAYTTQTGGSTSNVYVFLSAVRIG